MFPLGVLRIVLSHFGGRLAEHRGDRRRTAPRLSDAKSGSAV
jgi:hypothetical protein